MAKNSVKKKVLKHLKSDIRTFKHEAKEDRELMKKLNTKKKTHEKKESKKHEMAEKKHKPMTKGKKKFAKVMKEFSAGKLHSGSKKGPVVTNPKQAVAISYSEADRAIGYKPKKKKKK